MSTQKEKQLDCLGFDRMQLAAVKRNYQNNKPLYVRMEKLAEKINAAILEHRQLQADATASDLYTRNLAKRITGYELTSDKVLEFHADPAKWEAFKQQFQTTNAPEVPEVPEVSEIPQPAEESEMSEAPEVVPVEEIPQEDPEEAPMENPFNDLPE